MVKTAKQIRTELDRLKKIWIKKEAEADNILWKKRKKASQEYDKTMGNIRDQYNPRMRKMVDELKRR